MTRSILGFAVTVLLTATVHTAFAAGTTHVPATALAAANADLIARADRALRAYVAACSAGDDEVIARTVTNDAVIEYALDAGNIPRSRGSHAEQSLGRCRADGNRAAHFEAVDFSNERSKRRIRSLHHRLRRSIAGPGPGLRISRHDRDAR